MIETMLPLTLLITSFVLLSGLMAITEAAVLSVSHAEVEVMVHAGRSGAQALRRIKNDITRAVVVLVVLTNTINVLGPVLVGARAVEVYGSTAIGVVTAVMTLGTIIFSEIIPKSLGTHYAPRISLIVGRPVLWLIIVLYPVVRIFEALTNLMKRGERRVGTEDQVRSLVRLGHSAGYIETDESQLVHRVFQLNDRKAEEIMTPVDRMVSIPSGTTISGAAGTVRDQPYSRYPVVDSAGRVLGIVISHDLLRALTEPGAPESVDAIMRPPLVVRPGIAADKLLELFQQRKFHLAIVERDEKPVGLVTLEDALEELVGEIADEKES